MCVKLMKIEQYIGGAQKLSCTLLLNLNINYFMQFSNFIRQLDNGIKEN